MTQLLEAFHISAYTLLRIVAILFALVFAIAKRKAFGLSLFEVFGAVAFTVFGVIVGAKALYIAGQVIMHGSENAFWTWSNWSAMVKAGGVLYGSLFGAIGMIFLFAKIFERKATDILALGSIAFFGVNFFCRIGCYLAGCCYGVQMPNGQLFPYQMAEAVVCALIFIVFLVWEPEKNHKKLMIPLSLVLYAALRFVLEFFRGDESRGIWFLSTSQWISLLILPAGLILLRYMKKQRTQRAVA